MPSGGANSTTNISLSFYPQNAQENSHSNVLTAQQINAAAHQLTPVPILPPVVLIFPKLP
jgi:hypothetical protein